MSAISPFTGQHFAYAYGRIGVLKQFLLVQSDVDRLLGCHNKREAEKILTELSLTSKIDQGITSWMEILNAVENWVYKETRQMCPPVKQPVMQILWLEADLPLISYLLKKHHRFTSSVSKEPQSNLSAYGKDALKELINEDKTGNLPDHLIGFINKTKLKKYEKPDQIDTEVAQYIADLQLSLARASGSTHILNYVRHNIDLHNIRTALRFIKKENATGLSLHLTGGGTIPLSKLKASLADIVSAVDQSPISYDLGEKIRQGEEDRNIFERGCSDVIAEDIARMWNVPMSVEPLFAFAAITLNHLKLLRVILIGKSNELSPQDIKRIIPPFIPPSYYVLS